MQMCSVSFWTSVGLEHCTRNQETENFKSGYSHSLSPEALNGSDLYLTLHVFLSPRTLSVFIGSGSLQATFCACCCLDFMAELQEKE